MIRNRQKYLRTFAVLFALACCLAGCARIKSEHAGAEASGTDGVLISDALAEGESTERINATEKNTEPEANTKEETSSKQEEVTEKSDISEADTNSTESQSIETQSTESQIPEAQSTEEPVIKDMATIREEYIANLDLEDNPFWDSLVYTGYNIEKHYADGLMWHYVLAAHKRGKGWLSDITYAGGSLGYETTEEELPDIGFFEKHGLVCASYVSYVYFNYLPNVAGIDTSVLTKPEKSYSANDWYIAAKDWVEQGYSETIDFDAKLTGGFIDFEPFEEMPVGSIIAFCDARNKSDYCSHVVIYAGYQNDYHWVYHVGNENGPEFCSVQRMHFGPDPQWPIAVITTPGFVMEAITAAE